MNISKLKFPPIKYNFSKNFPDRLIYHDKYEYFDGYIDQFKMFSTKKSESGKWAIMRCFPERIDRDYLTDIPSLYIQMLVSNCSGSGFGTSMLNFAKNYSKKLGCGGRFHLSADVNLMPNRVPHPFYKKYGMNTGVPKIDFKIDRFVESGKDATYQDFHTVEMYYPPIKSKKKTFLSSVFYKILKFRYGLD